MAAGKRDESGKKCYIHTKSVKGLPMTNETKSTIRTVFFAYAALAVVAGLGYMLFDHDLSAGEAKSKAATTPAKESVKYVVPKDTAFLHGEDLMQRLKDGGLVVYFRHFATDYRNVPADKTVKRQHEISSEELLASCDIQRPLSDYGRLQARSVHEGIEMNSIPVGRVLSSPYCRTAEGAEIAFGKKPETHRDLIYATGEYSVESMSQHINALLGEQPESGNTFVMAHKTQMNDISKIGEGEAYVFEPLGDSSYNLIGKIRPEEWLLAYYNPTVLAGYHQQKSLYGKKN